mmetsp:Transcript_30986/g.67988  ORF Transcript_30986/g.67988 Transcript_30986/m.67988 type:complete len:115 (+) Transcript_30986:2-346(+)
MKTGRAADAEAQSDYEAQRASLAKSLKTQETLKAAVEKELSDLQAAIANTLGTKDQAEADHNSESDLSKALYSDCSWIDTHFESRREKRKDEMAGLVEAKNYLAGVESGDELGV